MAVRPQPQMREIEDGWRARDASRARVRSARRPPPRPAPRPPWRGSGRGQRGVLEQARPQMGEVPIGISRGAIRSSICATCTLFHGTSSFARRRSICHGVWPPLTAITKRPRAATAARASAAMKAAALAATASPSARISVFMRGSPDHLTLPLSRGERGSSSLPPQGEGRVRGVWPHHTRS